VTSQVVHAGGRAWPGLVIDLDTTLVTTHSDKELARPISRAAMALAGILRPGNAGSDTAADHIQVTDLVLAQIPDHERHGQPILIRADGAGASRAWLGHLHQLRTEQCLDLGYSVGFTMTDTVQQAILALPEYAWTPAVQIDGSLREGADVAELTGMLPELAAHGWPPGPDIWPPLKHGTVPTPASRTGSAPARTPATAGSLPPLPDQRCLARAGPDRGRPDRPGPDHAPEWRPRRRRTQEAAPASPEDNDEPGSGSAEPGPGASDLAAAFTGLAPLPRPPPEASADPSAHQEQPGDLGPHAGRWATPSSHGGPNKIKPPSTTMINCLPKDQG
jgi:hypothetical protein